MMMLNSRTAVGSAAVLFLFLATLGSLEVSLAELTCDSHERVINSSIASTYQVSSCGDLIELSPDNYHQTFVSDCKRWMGDSHPSMVSKYYVEWCEKQGDGSLHYYASVCCEETTDVSRCFERYNFIEDVEVMNQAHAVTCQAGQVCQTQVRFEGATGVGDGARAIRSTFCADPDTCYASVGENQVLCSNWSGLAQPECNYCCEGLFCNYPPHRAALVYVGSNPCMSGPCQNEGQCAEDGDTDLGYKCICASGYAGDFCEIYVADPCEPNPCQNLGRCFEPKAHETFVYRCACRTGWHGTNCDIAYPLCAEDNDYCANGGQCYDHGTNGFRCLCAEGFLGSRCEMRTTQCFTELSKRPGGYMTPEDTNCTAVTLRIQSRLTESLIFCKAHMRNVFGTGELYEDNVDGPVLIMESRSYSSCESGDWRSFVRNEFCCPTCYSLPCQNNGWCTQKQDGDYVCRCRAGWYGKNCELKQNLCMVAGDPHYMQFDGNLISFQGVGAFTLLESNEQSSPDAFHVAGINVGEGSVSYLAGMTVDVCGYTVELLRGTSAPVVKVDNVTISPYDHNENECFRIYMDGTFARLETNSELVVAFDGVSIGYVQVPNSMSGKVRGMCGNFDGDNTNDYRLRDNTDVISFLNRTIHFGIGWSVNKGTSVPEPTPDCDQFQDEIDHYCAPITDEDGIFAECFAAKGLDASTVGLACGLDVCAGHDDHENAACSFIQTIAIMCASEGHSTNWRSVTGCELECPVGLVPLMPGPACPATCQNPNAESTCGNPNTDVCRCPEGLIRNGEECVDPSTCGCVTLEGQTYELGASWITHDCSETVTCQECTSCDYNVGQLTFSPHVCPENHYCEVSAEGRGQCIPKLQCPDGMIYEQFATACPATCSDPTAPESCTEPESESCVCPEGLLLQDGICVEPSECTCEGGTRQPGEQWDAVFPCTSTRVCLDGQVTEVNKVCDQQAPCVSECGTGAIRFDDTLLDSNTEPITVSISDTYDFTATIPSQGDISLIKVVAGVPDTVECAAATTCTRQVTFTDRDFALGQVYVGAADVIGNTAKHVMVQVLTPVGLTPPQCTP